MLPRYHGAMGQRVCSAEGARLRVCTIWALVANWASALNRRRCFKRAAKADSASGPRAFTAAEIFSSPNSSCTRGKRDHHPGLTSSPSASVTCIREAHLLDGQVLQLGIHQDLLGKVRPVDWRQLQGHRRGGKLAGGDGAEGIPRKQQLLRSHLRDASELSSLHMTGVAPFHKGPRIQRDSSALVVSELSAQALYDRHAPTACWVGTQRAGTV